MRTFISRRVALLITGVACAVLASAVPVGATTLRTVKKICPYDGRPIEASVPMSGFSVASTFDFRPVGAIISPYPYIVCENGFVYFHDEFSDDELELLRPLIFSDEFKGLKDESVHFRAAWLIQKTSGRPDQIADELLQATWEAKSGEAYERYASKLLAASQVTIATEDDPARKLQRNLVKGELLRRLGRLDEARSHFQRLLYEQSDETDDRTLIRLQLAMIAAGDTGNALIPSEALEKARTSESWMATRQLVLPVGSRLKRVVSQFPTFGRLHYHWSLDSKTIYVATLQRSPVTIWVHTLVPAPASTTFKLDERQADLLATLPNGNLLLSVVGALDVSADHTRLAEVDPRNGETVMELPSTDGRLRWGPNPLSNDGRYVFVETVSQDIDVYSTVNHTIASIPFPSEQSEDDWRFIASDAGSSRVVLQGFAKNSFMTTNAILLWDFNRHKTSLRISLNGPGLTGLASWTLSNVLVDNPAKRLLLLWTQQQASQQKARKVCELQSFDAETGSSTGSEVIESVGRETPSITLAANRNIIALACGAELEFRDAQNPVEILESASAIGKREITLIQFSPDSRYLAVEIDKVVTVYEVGDSSP